MTQVECIYSTHDNLLPDMCDMSKSMQKLSLGLIIELQFFRNISKLSGMAGQPVTVLLCEGGWEA